MLHGLPGLSFLGQLDDEVQGMFHLQHNVIHGDCNIQLFISAPTNSKVNKNAVYTSTHLCANAQVQIHKHRCTLVHVHAHTHRHTHTLFK